MPNKIIKGIIEDLERYESYDDDGNKIINFWIKVNNVKYTIHLVKGLEFYMDHNLDVVLYVDDNNVAIAGLCPKKNLKWGNTRVIKGEVKETDRFELVEGTVVEKRKESQDVYVGSSATVSNWERVVTYTIVLPEKSFRVHQSIGKYVKPNTEIIALTENGVGYMIKDISNDKIYGKPKKHYLIALVLLIGFNIAMILVDKEIFKSYGGLLLFGNIFFGIIFFISFSSFLGSTKTFKLFNQMINDKIRS